MAGAGYWGLLLNYKNPTQKDPLISKISKTYIRRPQIKKFYKTDPPKSGNCDSKYNFEIFKKQKLNSKKTPKVPKNQKHIKGGLKSKIFIKQTPQK